MTQCVFAVVGEGDCGDDRGEEEKRGDENSEG